MCMENDYYDIITKLILGALFGSHGSRDQPIMPV